MSGAKVDVLPTVGCQSSGAVVSILESGATPEPWIVKRCAAPCAHNGDIGIVNGKGSLIAVAYAGKNASANARLIAAAPELLAVVAAVIEKIEDDGEPMPGAAWYAVHQAAIAALANIGPQL